MQHKLKYVYAQIIKSNKVRNFVKLKARMNKKSVKIMIYIFSKEAKKNPT